MSVSNLTQSGIVNFVMYRSAKAGSTYTPPPTGSYELIESAILTSNSSSVTFSNLGTYASTYKHLQLRIVTRNTSNVGTGALITIFNGDTGSNYTYHELRGNGSSVTSSAVAPYTSILSSWNPHGGTNPSNFGVAVADILDWSSTTKFKTVRSLTGVMSYANFINIFSGVWRNTAAITSITFTAEGGNQFVSGSRYSLYGLKGA